MAELYGSEGKKQVFYALKRMIVGLADHGRPFPTAACYDDACHLVLFLMKRQGLSATAALLSVVDWVIDRFHYPNHVDKWCKAHLHAGDRPIFDDACTEACEGYFSWLNKHGPRLRHTSSTRFGIYTLILIHLRNVNITSRKETQKPGDSQRVDTDHRPSEQVTRRRPFVKLVSEKTHFYVLDKTMLETYKYPSDVVILASPGGPHPAPAEPIPTKWDVNFMLIVGWWSDRLIELRKRITKEGIDQDPNPSRREAWRVEYREAQTKELIWCSRFLKIEGTRPWALIWAYLRPKC